MKLSLIIPTINRTVELERFLRHLAKQVGYESTLEVIVVDQNPDDRLVEIVTKYQQNFEIRHVRAVSKGQSHAKNVGLGYATGEFIGFPDDDCFYPDGFLQKLECVLKNTKENQSVFGRSLDPDTLRPIFSSGYPRSTRCIIEFHDPDILLSIQYTHFYPASVKNIRFDESFCSGSKWGSGEETDQLIYFLKSGGAALFVPELIVYHEFKSHFLVPENKLAHYARGFGALCRKHELKTILLRRSIKLLCGAVAFFLSLQFLKSRYCWVVFSRRLQGYYLYGLPNSKF